jgi:glycosyltransferase involved in cell wall biosynthesis
MLGNPQMARRQRLAVFGILSAEGGSVATAYFRVVDEWLRLGNEVDLYLPGSFIDPAQLVRWPNFRGIRIDLPPWKQVARLTPSRGLPSIARTALNMALHAAERYACYSEIETKIRVEHRKRPYDALVVLNCLSTFALERELPVISFPQGHPGCESEFIRRHSALVRDECGWAGWSLLRAAYPIRDTSGRRSLRHSTTVVVSSEWNRHSLASIGFPRERIEVAAPPVDLQRFRLQRRPADPLDFRFLWLGRIVPRKRFRLALEAFDQLLKRRPGVRLTVSGSAGYHGIVRHYRLPPLGPGVEHQKPIPHDDVPNLFARTDVVLQPSENENFGGAVAEGLACGVPSVLGPTNGTADITNGTEFRFDRYEPNDVACAMERAMDAVLADPEGIAQKARAAAERNLALGVIAERLLVLIDGVSDRWRSPLSRPVVVPPSATLVSAADATMGPVDRA